MDQAWTIEQQFIDHIIENKIAVAQEYSGFGLLFSWQNLAKTIKTLYTGNLPPNRGKIKGCAGYCYNLLAFVTNIWVGEQNHANKIIMIAG